MTCESRIQVGSSVYLYRVCRRRRGRTKTGRETIEIRTNINKRKTFNYFIENYSKLVSKIGNQPEERKLILRSLGVSLKRMVHAAPYRRASTPTYNFS